MTTAENAAAQPLITTRRAVKSLARAPKVPRRKIAGAAAPQQRRAAIVLRRGMKPTEFRRVEALFEKHGVTCSPVLVAPRRGGLADAPLCGLIVTGGDQAPSHDEREAISGAVRAALQRGAPVLALSDGAELALEAAGMPAVENCQGVLITDSVRRLIANTEVDDAITFIVRAAPR